MTAFADTSFCEILPWDSEFFGVQIARLGGGCLTPGRLRDALAWCKSNSVRCLYFLANSDDAATTRLAEENGFRLVDVRMTLECSLGDDLAPHRPLALVRPARPGDVAELGAIATSVHRDTRYYADPTFPRERCDALYAVWIEKSCRGWADAVFVAEHEDRLAGYITCHRDGRIGLCGVGEYARGRKLGSQLVHEALAWFRGHGLPLASVVTQGRNVHAQQLYQRAGFLTRSVQLSYHRWFTP